MADTINATPELQRDQVEQVLIQPLMAQSAVLGMPGIRRFNLNAGFSGPIRVTLLEDSPLTPVDLDVPATAVSQWRGEGEKIGEEDVPYGEVALLPPTLKSIKVIHRMSSEMARQAFLNVGSIAQGDLVRKVRRSLDLQFINGVGDGISLPRGLLQPGQAFNGVASTWDKPDAIFDVVDVALGRR